MIVKDGEDATNFESLKECKRRCKTAARELGYGEDVLEAIRNAKSNNEVGRIMRDARRNMS